MNRHFFQRKPTDGQQVHEKMLSTTSQGNPTQNHNEITTSHVLEQLLLKRQEFVSCGEDMEKKESLCTVGGVVNQCSHYGNSMEVSQKRKEIQKELPCVVAIGFLASCLARKQRKQKH